MIDKRRFIWKLLVVGGGGMPFNFNRATEEFGASRALFGSVQHKKVSHDPLLVVYVHVVGIFAAACAPPEMFILILMSV